MSNEYTTNKVSSDMINMMAKQMGAVHIKSDPAYINIIHLRLHRNFGLSTCWISAGERACTFIG